MAIDQPDGSSGRLFNRNFSIIITGQCAALLGNAIYSVVLVLYLKRLTESATVLGVVELLAFLPWILLGPFAGTLVDRVNRKTVIVWSYFLRGILMMTLSVFSLDYFTGLKVIDVGITGFHFTSFPFIVYAVFCVTACMGIIDSTFSAALNSIIPTILTKENVQKGNSLFQGAGGVLAMVGNALGGIFFTVLGGTLAFMINGLSYLSAAFASMFLSVRRGNRKTTPVASSFKGFIGETKEGFEFICANKGLRNMTIVYTLSNLFFPAVMLALPFMVEDVMKLGNVYYGYLLSILTLSSIVGYFVFGMFRTTEKQNYAVICGIFFVEAMLFLFLSLTTNVVLVFGSLALLSLCMAVSRLINTSLKQKVIPEALRGRVFGTLDSVNGGLAPLSFALSGVIIDVLNKNILLLFFIISMVYGLLAVAFVLNGPIRQFYLQRT